MSVDQYYESERRAWLTFVDVIREELLMIKDEFLDIIQSKNVSRSSINNVENLQSRLLETEAYLNAYYKQIISYFDKIKSTQVTFAGYEHLYQENRELFSKQMEYKKLIIELKKELSQLNKPEPENKSIK